ncbi:MAG: tol-pal system protein YbgF [Robiginitomaculum sp.]|nr:tol-pal system protein YbgF [Robiginitomaculum sp.]MDQ7078692.1 tol-pal system protein YbgF [Robiginitomaculum sp.]
MKRFALTLVLTSLLAGMVVPASASESKKEIAARLDALQVRVDAVERRMPAAVNMQQRLDDLEAQLRTLTGANERLEFENKKRQDELTGLQRAVDILATQVQNARDSAHNANAALGRFITGEDTAPTEEKNIDNGTQDEESLVAQQRYAEAKTYLEQGYFDQAQAAFEAFVAEHGNAPLAGPALFWLGEIAAVQGDYRGATNAYIETLKRFPKGSKAPEAMVKLGAALFALGEKEEACRALKAFPTQYPKASAGVRARAQIERRRAGCK